MLTAFARHGFFGLEVRAKGDLQVDYHHLVEDVGLCLGAAIDEALGGREGLARYGSSLLPFDDALALAAVDLATRPYLALDVPLSTERVGEFEVGLLSEFWRAVTSNGRFTLHLRRLAGENPHHVLEALFKAAGRALAEASRPDPRVEGAHSTKGIL
ncbi:MAG: imidazoleglycerol-phosphate dehydratase [Firmicutes bacterium]|nr:imidazoleglycerol-phosphate dehydratase [Bacillota bacterium]